MLQQPLLSSSLSTSSSSSSSTSSEGSDRSEYGSDRLLRARLVARPLLPACCSKPEPSPCLHMTEAELISLSYAKSRLMHAGSWYVTIRKRTEAWDLCCGSGNTLVNEILEWGLDLVEVD